MFRDRMERYEQLVKTLTNENKTYKAQIRKLECSSLFPGANFKLNSLLETFLKTFLKTSRTSSKNLLCISSRASSVETQFASYMALMNIHRYSLQVKNELHVNITDYKSTEGIFDVLRSTFIKFRNRLSKAVNL